MNKLGFTCHDGLRVIAVIVLACTSIYLYEVDYMQLILCDELSGIAEESRCCLLMTQEVEPLCSFRTWFLDCLRICSKVPLGNLKGRKALRY